MTHRARHVLYAAAALAVPHAGAVVARGADVSPPVILQYFEGQWQTMERRAADLFSAGYGAIWTPPPGRALYDDQGGGIGYNLYDRFDLGKARDRTAYGTEKQYRSLINAVHRTSGDVYVDYVHHHVGSWDVPAYNGWDKYVPESWQHVQDRSDYPGFELSDPYVGANSFNPNYRNLPGHRDSYPDAPPVNDGTTPQFQYQYRLAHLITIDLTSNRSFVRNPVPGNASNVRQAQGPWAIATSTLLPDGKVGGSTIVRQANTPTDENRRFYPDTSLPGITVTDPATGGGTYTIHPFNTANPGAGDPVAETPMGYMQRYAQWLVNDVGVDGLRIDAARHVPIGADGDPYNPNDVDVPALVDRATFRQSRRTNLDGSPRTVFNFQEVFTGDKGFNQQFIRKDINPSTPNVVGGNRDVLDFPLWFAMRGNMTGDGTRNNWFNIRNASQDIQDDGLANNGSQSIAFVVNHDDGRGHVTEQNSDYIVLDNVAHAWVLTRPGNAYVYYNSHEFDRTGNTQFFLKDGRGDALGGQHGNLITNLLDVRNSYGRGDFIERYIDNAFAGNPDDRKSAIYVYERDKSMLVGLNVGYNAGWTARSNVQTNFGPNVRLVELTGHHDDNLGASGSAFDGIAKVLITNASGQVPELRIPWNNAQNQNQGYVIYGLPRPQGGVTLSNVAQTIAPDASGTNATKRVTSIDVITANSFSVTLNTTKVMLDDGVTPGGYHDQRADGDKAFLRIDEGMDLHGNGHDHLDATLDKPHTWYGFENFSSNAPGYTSASGNGAYAQAINAAALTEGYHYLTARAYRKTDGNDAEIYTDFKKVVYVDRLPPQSAIDAITGTGANRTIDVRSIDQTADKVDVLHNLGAALSDAQIIALADSGSLGKQIDRDLFTKDLTGLETGTHALTILTREITGNYQIIRATGLQTAGGAGMGFGDVNASGSITASDVNSFRSILESSNQVYSPQAEANTDGLVNLADAFLLGPRLGSLGADTLAQQAYQNMIRAPFVTGGTYTVDANQAVHDVTAGTTHVLAGRTLSARSLRGNALNVASGATVAVAPKSAGGSASSLASIALTGSARLDLADTALVVRGASPGGWTSSGYTGVLGQVQDGYNGGAWTGAGIVTSRSAAMGPSVLATLGVAAAGDVLGLAAGQTTTWQGVTVGASDTLVMYTYGGDADLDAKIDGDDYFLIDKNLGATGAALSYHHGDFDYNGKVNGDDYFIIDSNYHQQAGAPLAGLADAAAPSTVTPVPEPAAFAALALLALGAGVRRQRRRGG
ncbi:MAG TPA: alpha-amylase family glycosyl hydrolase [Tepidisphaeraceae bacterium]|nr:alpha-amylase family glycosyl hydrolase [Tepidisphaeraceae bacterium]